MGCKRKCCFAWLGNYTCLLIIYLLLPTCCWIPKKGFVVDGRAIPSSSNTQTPTSDFIVKGQRQQEQGKKSTMMTREMMRSALMIGSSPPRCKLSCSNCVHCEPIQVPIVPETTRLNQMVHKSTMSSSSSSTASSSNSHHQNHEYYKATAYSRGDALSNYKPMSWKCKCGNFIFNP